MWPVISGAWKVSVVCKEVGRRAEKGPLGSEFMPGVPLCSPGNI